MQEQTNIKLSFVFTDGQWREIVNAVDAQDAENNNQYRDFCVKKNTGKPMTTVYEKLLSTMIDAGIEY